MRNPSSAIEYAVKELQRILRSHFSKLKVLKRALQRVQPRVQQMQPEEEKKEHIPRIEHLNQRQRNGVVSHAIVRSQDEL